MITRRLLLKAFAGGALGISFAAIAQQGKLWRIGFLGLTSVQASVSHARVEALRTGLRELGYVEGKSYALEFRWADGDYHRLPKLAEELVGARVDLLVTYASAGALAAKRATQTIPIVLASVGDPLTSGVVKNLARPGGNVTGSAIFTLEETSKRLELLRDAFPRIRRVAILINSANPLLWKAGAKDIEQAARKLNMEPQVIDARASDQFEAAFAAMAEKRAEGLIVFEDPLFTGEAGKLAALAVRHRLPSVGQVAFAEAGGLMGNGTNQLELFRRAAFFIDQIFKGAKPGDLPIEQSSRFELVVNMNAAAALGITLPKQLLFRADRVIEVR